VASVGLLDTSLVIALASDEALDAPEEGLISTVTLCELHHGVLTVDPRRQAARLAILAAAERQFEALPVDARVAPLFGYLMSESRRLGRGRPQVADALIAATAMSHGLPLYTRDRDFERMPVPDLVIV
jgi:tRNA(fMet)-specific endonuclease VapC